MTWQLSAFTVLGLALLAGFAWYERARPDARLVALVGTLAALAALGRIAFAAVPNVKPTTDIVLISGYALGGAPGFVVGALAGLSSNFFFGQGPWTPWQMAGWAVAGVIGALLGWALRGRVPGRLALAAVCGVVGFGFTALQDVGDWVTYSDHSAAQLRAYLATGLGFDAIHAVGCVAFALAIGPALIRSVQRFSRRLAVQWVAPAPPVVALAPLAVALAAAVAVAGAARPARAAGPTPARAAVAYLLGAQNADGGFGPAPGQPSGSMFSGWAALGLASAGQDLRLVARGPGVIAYIGAGTRAGADPGSLERTILVARAAGLSPRRVAGTDLVAALKRHLRRDGSIADQVNLTAFAVLALRAAGVGGGRMARSEAWLTGQQDGDGGFNFAGAPGTSDADDTGAALEALAGDPAARRAIGRAVAYLRATQDHDGGFAASGGGGSNAQSTAWAIQGLDAAGVSPLTLHRAGARSPLAYLQALTTPSGAIRYAAGSLQTPVWVTGEALMALEGRPLPVAPPPSAGRPARRAPARRPARRAPARRVVRHAPARATAGRRSGRPSTRPARAAAPASAAAPAPAAAHRAALRITAAQLATALGALTALALAPAQLR